MADFKKARRSIHMYGVSKPVEIRITADGVEMWIKGCKAKTACSWDTVAKRSSTPMNVPSYMAGDPIRFLKFQADKLIKKEAGV